mmetsp:Transcript_23032/g.54572  ORF Transcript_23032/g.54572 Transcript_23032/m.54572 type:complete len:226 (+) Transcript_23032:2039-2716(+)
MKERSRLPVSPGPGPRAAGSLVIMINWHARRALTPTPSLRVTLRLTRSLRAAEGLGVSESGGAGAGQRGQVPEERAKVAESREKEPEERAMWRYEGLRPSPIPSARSMRGRWVSSTRVLTSLVLCWRSAPLTLSPNSALTRRKTFWKSAASPLCRSKARTGTRFARPASTDTIVTDTLKTILWVSWTQWSTETLTVRAPPGSSSTSSSAATVRTVASGSPSSSLT